MKTPISQRTLGRFIAAGLLALLCAAPATGRTWNESEFENRPLFDYPLPAGNDSVVGSFTTYKIGHGDTLLDIGRWYGLSGTEISDANNHIDWWAPPVGREVVLPTEHILPEGPKTGIVLNIPEMRIYYFYPPPVRARRHRGKLKTVAFSGSTAHVVYTFPVGLGRFDWKTPVGAWTVTGKIVNPTWVVPQDIYEEHLERDGEADHVIPGGEPDNPLGHYKLALSLPEYGIHGTDVPWGVGMNVSHGCIRLYPEDIERLFMKTPVGTPGRFVYQPVKFGWRANELYVEVHDDLYGVYPGLWNHALHEVKRLHLETYVDLMKLEKAVEAKSGRVTYVMPGAEPDHTLDGLEAASLPPPPAKASAVASAATTNAARATAAAPADTMPAADVSDTDTENRPDDDQSMKPQVTAPTDSVSHDGDWEPLPSTIIKGRDSVE